ncbi:hypothetical protein [Rhodococcus sp. UNC363MFTsu5.1]|uniref:hypothetical protein n=1 Tax=Rhodococcus sp. UNC363MFTsu5.1 TaxID=1449069 RepID=UPI000480C6A4|nr:hypothetical protein [Rhodococcus sp. UNC363MFTsu5.1]
MTHRDVEAMLCAHLPAALSIRTVVELPPRFDESLPIILIQRLPSPATNRPFNGLPLTDSADLDIELYETTIERIRDLAALVRDELLAWQPGGVSVSEKAAFAKRPDYNPGVRKFGGVYTALVTRT